MHRNTIAAAAAAITLALSPAVYANPQAAPAATQMKPGEIRASKFIGSSVYDVQNQKIGSVKEMLFDPSGRIDKVVVDVGAFLGMGGKLVAIDLGDVKIANDRLTLDMTKDQLKAAQEFQYPATESTGSSMPPTNRPVRHHRHMKH
ncbi:MAG: PRC-barrel domain-containing protein [Thiohalocapsa sp.]